MEIGLRIKKLRTSKGLSQGDIEARTKLFKCYVSRVENGYTVPSVQTLEKLASALEVPLYKLFTDSDSAKPPSFPRNGTQQPFGAKNKEQKELVLFAKALKRMNPRDRKILMRVAARMAASA